MDQRDQFTTSLGMERIVRLAYERGDMNSLWEHLNGRVAENPGDAAAIMDMSLILQSLGQTREALQMQRQALELQRDFRVVHGDGTGVRILAFVTAGDFTVNTPIDFLLSGSDAVLLLRYVNADTADLRDLPDHDVAFAAIGESAANAPVLARLGRLLANWRGPIMNNDPERITTLSRDGVCAALKNEPSILSPQTWRVAREALGPVAQGLISLSDIAGGLSFPIVARPIGTHAGHGMGRVADAGELAAYLAGEAAPSLYVAPFIDYAGPDGLFSKQRVVFIDGKPYASHLAVSKHWMVHYLNADMGASAEKRAVEARWMADFDNDFAVRHADAFAALHRRIGLDYFGIDCAEMPDGRLLVFELDVAMIVHDMDDAEIYPYKKKAMRKLFDAFLAAAAARKVPLSPARARSAG